MHHVIPVCLDSNNVEGFIDCQNIGVMVYEQISHKWFNILDPISENPSVVNPSNRTFSFIEQKFFANGQDNNQNIVAPVTLRIGDLNYDGYPDFATILVDVVSH